MLIGGRYLDSSLETYFVVGELVNTFDGHTPTENPRSGRENAGEGQVSYTCASISGDSSRARGRVECIVGHELCGGNRKRLSSDETHIRQPAGEKQGHVLYR